MSKSTSCSSSSAVSVSSQQINLESLDERELRLIEAKAKLVFVREVLTPPGLKETQNHIHFLSFDGLFGVTYVLEQIEEVLGEYHDVLEICFEKVAPLAGSKTGGKI